MINNQYMVSPQQSKTKPRPEDLIPQLLPAEQQVNATDFIDWLRENKLSPKWNATNKYRVDCKGKLICYVTLFPLSQAIWWQTISPDVYSNSWEIWINIHEHDCYANCDDSLRETAWKNVNICKNCKTCYHGIISRTICGKEFSRICHYGGGITIRCPDTKTLENAKKLLLMNKEAIVGAK